MRDQPFRQGRVAALDGLRALAVLAVVGLHLGVSWVPGGSLGVDVFFVLSGYLITSLLLDEIRDTGRVALVRFYERRARRLLPALALMAIAVSALLMVDPGIFSVRQIVVGLGVTLLYVNNAGWAMRVDAGPFQHCWSLSLEEQFYLVWPVFLMWFKRRLRSAEALVSGLLALWLAATVVRVLLSFYGAHTHHSVFFRLSEDFRLDLMILGSALAAERHSREKYLSKLLRLGPLGVGVAVALVVTVHATVNGDSGQAYLQAIARTAVGLSTVLIINDVMDAGSSTALSKVLSFSPLAYIGRISYGIYLWHYPLAAIVAKHTHDGVARGLVTLTLSLAVAAASFELLERRFLKRGARPGSLVGVAAPR